MPRGKKRHRAFNLIAVILITAMAFGFYGCEKKKEIREEAKISVKMAKAGHGKINREFTFTGTFTSKNRVEILPRIQGRVEKVFFDEGDHVNKGQLLIKLEDDDLKAQLKQAGASVEVARARLGQARSGYSLTSSTTSAQVSAAADGISQARENVAQAKSSFENAKLEYNRMKRLYKRGAVAKQTLDNVTTQYEIAQSRLKASRIAVEQARENYNIARANTLQTGVRRSEITSASAGITQAMANLQYLQVTLNFTRIKSSINGVITARNVEPGQIVGPGNKTPSMIITDNSVVYLEANIPESEMTGLKIGEKVDVVAPALENRKFKGRILAIVPSADPASRTFKIKVSVSNPKEMIKNGMSGRATVQTEVVRGVMTPRHWLKIIEGEFYVVKMDKEGKAKHSKVVTEYYNEEKAIIKSGLKKDEKLVVVGHETLKDGDRLDVKEVMSFKDALKEIEAKKPSSSPSETPPKHEKSPDSDSDGKDSPAAD